MVSLVEHHQHDDLTAGTAGTAGKRDVPSTIILMAVIHKDDCYQGSGSSVMVDDSLVLRVRCLNAMPVDHDTTFESHDSPHDVSHGHHAHRGQGSRSSYMAGHHRT